MTTEATPETPRRFQFSLRALMAFMVLVAVISTGIGMWWNWRAEQRRPRNVILGPGNFPLLEDVLAERVIGADDKQLERYASSTDHSLALAAGWERLRRQLPPTQPGKLVDLNDRDLETFLQLVEEHLDIDPPAKWSEALLASEPDWYGHVVPGDLSSGLGVRGLPTLADSGITLEDAGDYAVVEQEGKQWELRDLSGFSHLERVAILHEENADFVAAYNAGGTYSFELHCFAPTGQEWWSTEVWASGGGSASTGREGYHFVEFRANEETIVVFGATQAMLHVEAFDKKTGKPLCRFCSHTVYRAAVHSQ